MAIGDNHNDAEMLAFAGLPFIMGNACEELKSRGWQVTLSNDQNGVAAAIEQMLPAYREISREAAPEYSPGRKPWVSEPKIDSPGRAEE